MVVIDIYVPIVPLIKWSVTHKNDTAMIGDDD